MMKAPEMIPEIIKMTPRNLKLNYKLKNWTLTIKDGKKRTVKVLLSPKLMVLLKVLVNDQ